VCYAATPIALQLHKKRKQSEELFFSTVGVNVMRQRVHPKLILNLHALLLVCASHLRQRSSIGCRLERYPFSGLVYSAGELLHTPERIPTSMTTVLLFIWTNTLCGVYINTLTQLSVHPASPVLLTKNGPLGAPIQCPCHIKWQGPLTYLKFENRSRMLHPRGR